MATIIVDAGDITLPEELQREIQDCVLCKTARLCFAYCCPKHYESIKDYVREVEETGDFVGLKWP